VKARGLEPRASVARRRLAGAVEDVMARSVARWAAPSGRGVSVFAGALALACAGLGCGSDEKAGLPPNTGEAVRTYGRIVLASYEDSLAAGQSLDAAAKALAAGPTAETLKGARDAWLAAREPYLQTEVYRFYDGPIDNPEDGPEGLVNAWPMDEAYVDYVDGKPMSGIINDSAVTIERAKLVSLNEQGGEENIATGFHAVEFLLWGQDKSATGPGDRPHTDYVRGAGATASNQERRARYLTEVTTLLSEHLQDLVSQWRSGGGSYRDELEAAPPAEAMRRILTGMIVLSGFETGGERLQTALDSGDQEDEHSCFSDNTHRDMVQDVQGISNVWSGNYMRLDRSNVTGTGIKAVVQAANPALADQLDALISDSLRLAKALQPPFDQEIAAGNAAGRARVKALITALRAQEKALEEVFRLFGLTVPEPE
jgi:putative iron-regulated protein